MKYVQCYSVIYKRRVRSKICVHRCGLLCFFCCGILYMFSYMNKERLKKNWGEKADALDCFAEVKIMDPISSWCCYVFAMDENEEQVQCLLYSNAVGIEINTIPVHMLDNLYNEHGESPIIDREYRPMKISHILKRLS